MNPELTASNPGPALQRSFREIGFTLIEMLVVLVILALVAQTAVLSVDSLVEAERRNSTVQDLDDARTAIVGRDGVVDASGRAWIEGFVNDIGRLPIPDGDGKLSELFGKPIGILGFKEQPVQGTVLPGLVAPQMLAGWRGPYLKLGVGNGEWLDGWSRPFAIEHEAEPLGLIITSFGADGLISESSAASADADLELRFDRNDVFGEFLVDWTRPEDPADPAEIRIEIWHPQNGSPVAHVTDWTLASSSPARVYTTDDEIPIGHRKLVVLLRPSSGSPISKVIQRPITVVPQGLVGGDMLIDLGWSDPLDSTFANEGR